MAAPYEAIEQQPGSAKVALGLIEDWPKYGQWPLGGYEQAELACYLAEVADRLVAKAGLDAAGQATLLYTAASAHAQIAQALGVSS